MENLPPSPEGVTNRLNNPLLLVILSASEESPVSFDSNSINHSMNFKQVASFDNYMLANMTLGLLQENGINCHIKDEHIVTVDPLLNPAVGGIKILVEESEFEKAQALLKQAEVNYVKEIACPHCRVHALTVEEITNAPADAWGKLKNRILYGQAATYKKQYRCTHCNHVFDELPLSF